MVTHSTPLPSVQQNGVAASKLGCLFLALGPRPEPLARLDRKWHETVSVSGCGRLLPGTHLLEHIKPNVSTSVVHTSIW